MAHSFPSFLTIAPPLNVFLPPKWKDERRSKATKHIENKQDRFDCKSEVYKTASSPLLLLSRPVPPFPLLPVSSRARRFARSALLGKGNIISNLLQLII